MRPVSLIGAASFLPETVVDNDFFGGAGGDASKGPMFRGSKLRHHVAPHESAADMIVCATEKLAARHGLDPCRDIDLLLTNVSIPDMPFTGCGAVVAKRLGCEPRFVIDLQNTGCVSFVFMMKLAQSLMSTSSARTALICNAQTAGGRIFGDPGNRGKPQSAVPGDGCGVGLLVAGDESPVKSIATRCYTEFAEDMNVKSDDGNAWWAPRATPFHVDFTESRIASIVSRGNRMVPDLIRDACSEAGITPRDIGLLVTNQPNPIFLRNWRESLGLPAEAHVDTFAEHGNLFGAGIPISLERALEQGKLAPGSHLVLGGFSHAGDYAAAAVVHWQPR